MRGYTVETPTAAHVDELARNMRPADVAEVWAAAHHSPKTAIQISIQGSRDPKAVLYNGKVLCIFGVAEGWAAGLGALSTTGMPWMLTSHAIRGHRKMFLQATRREVQFMRAQYPLLVNYVDARHAEAIRWLRWLGFNFADEPTLVGPDQSPFYRFEMVS